MSCPWMPMAFHGCSASEGENEKYEIFFSPNANFYSALLFVESFIYVSIGREE